MSVTLMAEVWRRDVSGTEQQVLLVLCDHANDNGANCYPSVPLIAWKIGVSDRTVRRIIKELEQRGVLGIYRQDGKANNYRVNLDALESKAPLTKLCHPRQRVTPDKAMSPHPGHNSVTPTPDIAMSSEPSVEPSKNHQVGAERSKPKKSVSEEFAFSEALLKWAEKNDFTARQLASQRELFIDHHLAAGNVMKDWDAAFRKWMRNAREWGHLKPDNMVTLAPPKVVTNPDYEGTYDPLRKFTPEAEDDYHQQMAESIARDDGITLDEARERIKGWAA